MKFYLNAKVTISARTEVDAESLESAIKIAQDREVVLGGTNSGADVEEQWIVEDADGSPEDIHE